MKVTQSCPTLCDPVDCSPPGSSVHGILQARILEWVAISFSKNCITPWNSPGQNTGVGSFSLLQGIFPTQGSNPGLPHCRQIIYQLSHKGSPRILECRAYPFSSGSSRPRNWTGVSCIAPQADSLPTELSGKPSETVVLYILSDFLIFYDRRATSAEVYLSWAKVEDLSYVTCSTYWMC